MLTQLALLCAIAGALTRTSFAAAFADDNSLPNQASSSASAPTAKLISPITSPTDASDSLHERLTCSSYLYVVLPTNVSTSSDTTSTAQFPFKADILTDEVRDSASHWEWIRIEPCGVGLPEQHYLLLPSPTRCTPSSTDLGAEPPSFRRCRDIPFGTSN
ncbi:hypothetical protein BC629DRAFT_631563 [Irpex lacteus]|nr:hypothetical protein BC629DRAFT_631563 [Irpex lacteus]